MMNRLFRFAWSCGIGLFISILMCWFCYGVRDIGGRQLIGLAILTLCYGAPIYAACLDRKTLSSRDVPIAFASLLCGALLMIFGMFAQPYLNALYQLNPLGYEYNWPLVVWWFILFACGFFNFFSEKFDKKNKKELEEFTKRGTKEAREHYELEMKQLRESGIVDEPGNRIRKDLSPDMREDSKMNMPDSWLGLCGECKKIAFPASAQPCPECDVFQTNGAWNRCAECARKKNQCSYCSKPFLPGREVKP